MPRHYFDIFGSEVWETDSGYYHRIDGPAIIFVTGNQEWWENGIRHRIGGPARTWIDGSEEWWVNGVIHRDDGPSLVYAGGYQWIINGENVTDNINEWMQENNITYPFTDDQLTLFKLRWC